MRLEEYTSQEELRRLVQAFLSIVVAIALATLFLVIVVPGLRGLLVPAPGEPAVPAARTGWLDLTDYPPMKGYTVPPVEPRTLLVFTPVLLERGGQLYDSNCVPCHGVNGRGDGPAAVGLNPRPRDLSRPDGWKNGPRLSGIFTTLEKGIPGSAMAAFEVLSPPDRMALAHKVQALAAFPRPDEDPAALAALSARLATAPEVVPPRIPVKQAEAALVKEAIEPPVLFGAAPFTASRAARLWNKIVMDRTRAAESWRSLHESLLAQIPDRK
ncbi:MAG: cytochrome c [Candidatus Riflebacteria bacterium]|nr:cytochrome c [Candidatus Riflebacteria bacterium]